MSDNDESQTDATASDAAQIEEEKPSPVSGSDLQPTGRKIRDSIQNALDSGGASDALEALADAYAHGPELVREFEKKAVTLRDLYQEKRRQNNKQARASKKYREAEEWRPQGRERMEAANEAWDEADERLAKIEPKIDRLEDRLDGILDELRRDYIDVAEARFGLELEHPRRNKRHIMNRAAKPVETRH